MHDPGVYEVGRIYTWQNLEGEFAPLNGAETTVTGYMITYFNKWSKKLETGWPTDTICKRNGEPFRAVALVGHLRPKNEPPKGEQIIRDLFIPSPELVDA